MKANFDNNILYINISEKESENGSYLTIHCFYGVYLQAQESHWTVDIFMEEDCLRWQTIDRK